MNKSNINLTKLGILGGGQLGKMLVQSAMDYNFESINILEPNSDAPCRIFKNLQIGSITDFNDVYNFGKNLDIITIEIENVNTEALKKLEKEGKLVYPQANVIAIIKNKALQKQFYLQNNIPSTSFSIVNCKKEIIDYKNKLPLVQKTQTAGYDGKGVCIIKNQNDIDNCIDAPSILEEMVDIEKELAIIVVRSIDGEIKSYPIVEMFFNKESNLLEYLLSPANISEVLRQEINNISEKIASLLKIVGVFAIEFFLTKKNKILVNEIAPRVHNSGHHTKGGFLSSQFDSHIRAISGLQVNKLNPIYKYASMINILGPKGIAGTPLYKKIYESLNYNNTDLTLYGKKQTSPYRKLGHISIFDNDYNNFKENFTSILNNIRITSDNK